MENKPRWGDKTPQYVRAIPTLAEIFPEARFIHIIRDGRDVALSLIRERFGPGNVYTAAGLWRETIEAGRRGARILAPDQYLEVRYEALTGNPGETLRSICAFVGESIHEDVLELSRLPPGKRLITEARRTPMSTGRVIARNSNQWKGKMSRSSRRRLTLLERWRRELNQQAFWWWQRLRSNHPREMLANEWILRKARTRAVIRRWFVVSGLRSAGFGRRTDPTDR